MRFSPSSAMPTAMKADVTLPHTEELAFFREQYWSLVGFSAPFLLLLQLPVVGVLGAGLAHAASAHMLAVTLRAGTRE